MSFYEIEFPLRSLDPAVVEALLFESGASSITFLDRGDEPVLEPRPGEMRLWTDTLVRGLYADAVDPAAALGRLTTGLGEHVSAARIRRVADRAWERVWLADWRPMRFGRRLWICPASPEAFGVGAPGVAAPGVAAPTDAGAVIVRLDPGLAFGTGTHPTTALCLEALDALELTGRRFLDYGCGSGVLAIAALKLGARHAIGVDLDPQALLASRENAIRNGVSELLTTQDVEARLPAADCVVANILADVLIDLAPALTAACAPAADLILSGILAGQGAAVCEAYRTEFEVLHSAVREDWCRLHLRLRAPRAGENETVP
jgi:ribosomal protein L11 methyltransferase